LYLSDKDIVLRLPDLRIECNDPNEPFRREEQVQPSSIDLRLDKTFWSPRKARVIDLQKSSLLELSPRRYWKQRALEDGESITLQPGKLILGRVYEKFTVPKDCAGRVEGRSSFARMGLGVHIGANFVNPGWRGHMPLQLVNHGNTSIRLFPYIPICQLLLVKLTQEPERVYGEKELQSKYMDDDGGPSYWWRDKRIGRLQAKQAFTNLSLRVQEQVLKTIGAEDPDVVEEFDEFISKQSVGSLESASTVLEAFSKSQEKFRRRSRVVRRVSGAIFPILAGTSLGILFVSPLTYLHFAVWAITVASFWPFLRALRSGPRDYFDKAKYSKWEWSESHSPVDTKHPSTEE
jgi:deoxycytidine triphosphate deaminase